MNDNKCCICGNIIDRDYENNGFFARIIEYENGQRAHSLCHVSPVFWNWQKDTCTIKIDTDDQTSDTINNLNKHINATEE